MMTDTAELIVPASVPIIVYTDETRTELLMPTAENVRSIGVQGGVVAPHTQALADRINREFGVTHISTYPGHNEAPPIALDMFWGKALGDRIAQWVVEHWDELDLHYWMWWRRIFNPSIARYWRAVADRGTPTKNHEDHGHASLKAKGSNRPESGGGGGDGMLRLHSIGPVVRHLQEKLNHHGFPCAVDGHFGPETDGRVRAFQGSRGLVVDGIVGSLTWAKLNEGTAPPPAPSGPKPSFPAWPGRFLRRGMSGGDVQGWQQQMANRGWDIGVDGDFGPQTERICRQFQQEKGLDVDGVIGPLTWEAAWLSPVT